VPIVDPDIISLYDINEAIPGTNPTPAIRLLNDRSHWITQKISAMEDEVQKHGLDALLKDPIQGPTGIGGLGKSISDLIAIRNRRDQGKDISSELAALGIAVDSFDYLLYVVELDQKKSPILDAEWENVYSLLLQRLKHSVLSNWRKEESQSGVYLSPSHFHLRSPEFSEDPYSWKPKPWRSTSSMRQKWVNTLKARILQEQTIKEQIAYAINIVEESSLVRLRDWLLNQVSSTGSLSDLEKEIWFTRYFQIDCQAASCRMTTRIAQAIETIQGVLFGARNGSLEDSDLTLDDPDFDAKWQWLRSYATWKSAMRVFLYPETALRPTLRRKKSSAFDDLVEKLRNMGTVDPKTVHDETLKYEQYFRDICSLTTASISVTSGLLGDDPDYSDQDDVLAIGRATQSGRFYFSAWKRISGWGISGSPFQTPWKMVLGPEQAQDIVGALPFQDANAKTHLGIYAQNSVGGSNKFFFADFKYNEESISLKAPEVVDVLPALVCSAEYDASIPAFTLYGSEVIESWTIQKNDQVVAADVDGDRRSEIIIFRGLLESDGSRRIGVFRCSGGGLSMYWSGSLAGGWHLPDPKRPCVSKTVPQWAGMPLDAERILVANANGTQIGSFGWVSPKDGFQILNPTSNVGNWKVSMGPPDDPTVFVAANIDGFAKKLLIFEHKPNGRSYPNAKTTVHVFDWSDDRFLFRSGHDLNHSNNLSTSATSPPNYDAIWKVFLPVRSGYGPSAYTGEPREDIIAITNRHFVKVTDSSGNPIVLQDPNVNWIRTFRWGTDRFPEMNSLHPDMIYAYEVPSIDGNIPPWKLDPNDTFIAVGPTEPNLSQHVLAFNPSSLKIGVLVYANGLLKVAWQKNGRIDGSTSSQSWNLSPDDLFVAADINGDNILEILLIRPDAGRMGLASMQSNKSLLISWLAPINKLPGPGGIGNGWLVTTKSDYISADIDDDGYQEVIASFAGEMPSTNLYRLGVLHGIPESISRRLQGVPTRLGPVNVTVLDIREKIALLDSETRGNLIRNSYDSNSFLNGQKREYIYHQIFYLDEAYYYVPLELALRLSEGGHYMEALDWFRSVYDYSKQIGERKIAYKLVLNGQEDFVFARSTEWLQRPLDPHAIAETRKDSYSRYTILSIAKCLIDYADTEFTRSTSESIAHARELYLEALDLLTLPELQQYFTDCSALIDGLKITVGSDEEVWVWNTIKKELSSIDSYPNLLGTVEKAKAIMASAKSSKAGLSSVRKMVKSVKENLKAHRTVASVMENDRRSINDAVAFVLANPKLEEAAANISRSAYEAASYSHRIGDDLSTTAITPSPYTVLYGIMDGDLQSIDTSGYWKTVPAPLFYFCIQPNPVIAALRMHAQLNLKKIRNCRNIAGMEMSLEPYAASTSLEIGTNSLNRGDEQLRLAESVRPQPLPYRYAILVERAKQIIDIARQIEASMIATLEKQDTELYAQMKSRQDLLLARAGVRIKEVQLTQAGNNVHLMELQRDRAQFQMQEYRDRILAGLTANENIALGNLWASFGVTTVAAIAATAGIISPESLFKWAGAGVQPALATASALSTLSQIYSTYANYERRAQDWRLSQQLASRDVQISNQQIVIAEDNVRVASQEYEISGMQVEHGEAILDFLTTKKFGTAELYEWMSGILENIYRYFLQQATSMAKLAETQLAFERQEIQTAFIRSDYWESHLQSSKNNNSTQGNKGLTGAERLLRDITELLNADGTF
jgi:hypothetical protein